VAPTVQSAARAARAILELRERDLVRVRENGRSPRAPTLLDALLQEPIVTIVRLGAWLNVTQPTANGIVRDVAKIGLLEQTTWRSWGRVFRYRESMTLLAEGA
jgi:hypothetical protein